MSTFVSVGNPHQPFSRLLAEVERVAGQLPQPVTVQHGHTPFASSRCRAVPFMSMDEFEREIAQSALVILHAGGGGVLHAVQSGKVPVIVPRRLAHGEHLDDHQLDNARELGASGKAVVAEDPADLLQAAGQALARQAAQGGRPGPSRMLLLVTEALERHAAELGQGRSGREPG